MWAETVHKLPLFREAFAKRRCLIPATGFYEWQKREDDKQPYRSRRKDLEPVALNFLIIAAVLFLKGMNKLKREEPPPAPEPTPEVKLLIEIRDLLKKK